MDIRKFQPMRVEMIHPESFDFIVVSSWSDLEDAEDADYVVYEEYARDHPLPRINRRVV
jgi:hypothetical protein